MISLEVHYDFKSMQSASPHLPLPWRIGIIISEDITRLLSQAVFVFSLCILVWELFAVSQS